MKPKTEELLYWLLWLADERGSVRMLGEKERELLRLCGVERTFLSVNAKPYLTRNRLPDGIDAVQLTEEGIRLGLGGVDLDQEWGREWDGKWRMVLFDLPETLRWLRLRIRRMLKDAHFGNLQNSVWITPWDLTPIRMAMGEGGADVGKLATFEGTPGIGETAEDIVAQAWNWEKINTAYEQHAEFLKECPQKSALTEWVEWAREERQRWREILQLEPRLPKALHPEGYPGETIWRQRLLVLSSLSTI